MFCFVCACVCIGFVVFIWLVDVVMFAFLSFFVCVFVCLLVIVLFCFVLFFVCLFVLVFFVGGGGGGGGGEGVSRSSIVISCSVFFLVFLSVPQSLNRRSPASALEVSVFVRCLRI